MKKITCILLCLSLLFVTGCSNNAIGENTPITEDNIIDNNVENNENVNEVELSDIESIHTLYQQFLDNEISAKVFSDAEVSFAKNYFDMVLSGTLSDMIEQYGKCYGKSEISVEYMYVPIDDTSDALAVAIANSSDVENPEYMRLECILMVVDEELQIVFEGGQYNRDWLSIYEKGYLVSGYNTDNTHESVRYITVQNQGVRVLYKYFSGNLEYYSDKIFVDREQKDKYQEVLENITIAQIIMNRERYYTVYMYECEDDGLKDLIINSGIFDDGTYYDSNEEFENLPIQYALDEYNIVLPTEAEWIYEWEELETENNTSVHIENSYFVNNFESVEYSVKEFDSYMWNTDVDTVELQIDFVQMYEDGAIYHLYFTGAILEDPRRGDRTDLGYFYVTPQEIYYRVSNPANGNDDILQNALVMVQSEDKADLKEATEQGWHDSIVHNGEQVIYDGYAYTTEGASNFYERYVWERGKGLVEYESGYLPDSYVLSCEQNTEGVDWN